MGTKSWIIELGYSQRIPNAQPEDKVQQEWISKGFYALRDEKGPIIVELQEQAYKFPVQEYAHNVVGGDERLKASRIVEVQT